MDNEMKKWAKRMQDLFMHFVHAIRESYFWLAYNEESEKINLLRQYAIEYIVEVIPDYSQHMYFNALAEVTGTGV
jgi:hypothetical protein